MARLRIRNIKPRLWKKLRRQAKANGRSVDVEIGRILQNAVGVRTVEPPQK